MAAAVKGGTFIVTFLLLLLVLAFVLPMAARRFRSKEGFQTDRAAYIAQGQERFNKLADAIDGTRPHLGWRSEDRTQVNRDIQSALVTADMEFTGSAPTRMSVYPDSVRAAIPPPNAVLAQAKVCETLRTRDACAKLDDPAYADCGVCIKDGTAYTDPSRDGKYIGGLLALPDDRADAEAAGTAYQPTVGECPAGYFFVKRDACEKAVNREDCKEAGQSGGFSGGKTAEGKSVVAQKCAQAPSVGSDVFVYEPRGRKFNVNLRVITPIGTGVCRVHVTRASGGQVGFGSSEVPGKEFIVPVRNVGEADALTVQVVMEAPYRKSGKPEVFQYAYNPQGAAYPPYNQNEGTAAASCERIGARAATRDEVQAAYAKGAQACSCAYTSGNSNVYPMQGASSGCGSTGINVCSTQSGTWNDGKGHAWCYGVKPPQSTNMSIGAYIFNFFTSRGKESQPSQEGQPSIWSEHGADYQAQYTRAVLLQWESEDGKRIVGFEPSIVAVNGQGPSTVGSDGSMTFQILRRFGTFNKSAIIMAPRPRAGSPMLTNQYWIWSNQPLSQTVQFGVKVPGIFAPPVYAEDAAVVTRGPLISDPETAKLLRTSPCMKDDQKPGAYSIECLTNLFVSAGGNPTSGKLATTNGGLSQLNANGSMDDIAAYLNGLYALATTGRDADGKRAGTDAKSRAAAINQAAQLMFGFDITTPCEDIAEDAQGNIVVVPRTGALDADCLDYLWMNTGNDRDRGFEDRTRKSVLQNTYTTIADRFSGLRSNEGSQTSRATYPFQACQRTGSKAPIRANGAVNPEAVREANAKGALGAIQDWYNSIHKTANYAGGATAEAAIEACYGVRKSPDAPKQSTCSVPARYVRVLPTHLDTQAPCIQIPQIQVFDEKGVEVARGKPATAPNAWPGTNPQIAVNGNTAPRSHWDRDSEYHDDCRNPEVSYWQVDLGKSVGISRIVYSLRTDCCDQRQIATPIQLLDASGKIVAQKLLGYNTWPSWDKYTPLTLTFTLADSIPQIPANDIRAGARLSFATATSFDRWLVHQGGTFVSGATNNKEMPLEWRTRATFTIVPALNGAAGCISFESVSNPQQFLRHSGYRCYLHPRQTDRLYMDDASFRVVPSLNGDPTMVSFQSVNTPSHYIATKRGDPGTIWITTVNKGSAWDVQRACWTAKPALA